MADRSSPFGCVRFHQSPFSRLATLAGNQGCMAPDGSIFDSAHAAAEKTAETYVYSVLDAHQGQMPPDFMVLSWQMMRQTLLHALYLSAGAQVFQFTAEILAEFRRTDLTEAPVGKLVLPYAAGFLHFGQQPDILLDDTWRESAECLDGAYFHCAPDGALMIQLTLSRPGGRASALPGPSFSIDAEDLKLSAHAAIDRALDADLGPHKENDAAYQAAQEWSAATRPLVHAALSLVLNALFYLDGYGADTELRIPDNAPPALQEKFARAKQNNKPKAIRDVRNALVVEGFTLVRLCGVAVQQEASQETLAGDRAVRTHWRRGHWRMQPHGPRLSLVKRLWIRPALVAPGASDTIKGHVYVAQEPPT